MGENQDLKISDNNIGELLVMTYILEIGRLVIIIVNTSYILGQFALIFFAFQEDFIDGVHYNQLTN